ncbi:MAG: hypothetical protein IJ644_09900 [Oscillospiraceae bacterium]|nr:hypothetical protein [Oscillospiraceae bacterium]
MKLFFIIALILLVLNLGILWYLTAKGNPEQKVKNISLNSVSFGIVCFHTVIGLLEFAGFLTFYGTFLFMGIVSLLSYLAFWLYKKKNSRTAVFAVKAVAIAAVLELTLFNIPSYRVFWGGYEERTLLASEAHIESSTTSLNKDGDAVDSDNKEMVLTYWAVDIPVRTVSADVTFSDEEKGVSTFIVDAKDAAYSGRYRYNIAEDKIVALRSKSNTLTLELSGAVSDIRLKFQSIGKGSVTVHSMTLNAMIPFEIYYSRFLFLVLGSVFVYAVMQTVFFAKSYREKEKFCRIVTLLTAVCCCIATLGILNYKLPADSWAEKIREDKGNQVSKELVLAFEQGHVWLDAEPTPELLELENPYDRYLREKATKYEWDHVLYNGRYYSYYGIAPVILVFLPFHKITGYYLPNELAVALFSVIGFFGLAFFLMEFVRKWFSEIPAGMYLTAMLMLFLNCGIWFSIGRPDFYEVAMASGFAFVTWGWYFLFSANILSEGKISLRRTCISSLFMAIAVLCRPTLVLYCICGGAFLLFAVKRASASGRKQCISYLLCAFVPMAVLGSVQMWYNYVRFDSPFEFGIQYSLTINDFTKAEFHPALSWIAVYNYLFNAPVFSAEYPQINTIYQDMQVNGFFYHDLASGNTSGLFWLMPPLLAYLFSGKALKELPDSRTRLVSAVRVAVPCVLIPVGIIASVWESGYAARYMSDFAWQMICGAYAVIFFLYLRQKDTTKQQFIRLFMCGSLLYTCVVSGVQIFDFIFQYRDKHYDFPEMAYIIDRLFTFWR